MITTELGGGGRVPAAVHELAWSGLTNVLRHVGVLEGEVQTRASLGKPDAVILDGRDPANYVIAPEDGIFEGLLEPPAEVKAGDPVARLWFPDTPGRPPEVLRAPLDGVLAVIRSIPATEAGDGLFTTGQPIDPRRSSPDVSLFAWLGGRTFASLRNHRNYRLYFVSHGVSFVGTWMQQIAAYWLVLELTGSPLAVGTLALAQLLPVTLFGLLVGSVIDRFDVRRLLLVTESLSIVAAGTLAVLTLTGAVALWQVYVIAIFQGARPRARQPGPAHARVPDRREGGPAERGRARLGSRHDGAHRRAGPRRARRRPRRGRRRLRRELGQLPRGRRRAARDAASARCARTCRPRCRPASAGASA